MTRKKRNKSARNNNNNNNNNSVLSSNDNHTTSNQSFYSNRSDNNNHNPPVAGVISANDNHSIRSRNSNYSSISGASYFNNNNRHDIINNNSNSNNSRYSNQRPTSSSSYASVNSTNPRASAHVQVDDNFSIQTIVSIFNEGKGKIFSYEKAMQSRLQKRIQLMTIKANPFWVTDTIDQFFIKFFTYITTRNDIEQQIIFDNGNAYIDIDYPSFHVLFQQYYIDQYEPTSDEDDEYRLDVQYFAILIFLRKKKMTFTTVSDDFVSIRILLNDYYNENEEKFERNNPVSNLITGIDGLNLNDGIDFREGRVTAVQNHFINPIGLVVEGHDHHSSTGYHKNNMGLLVDENPEQENYDTTNECDLYGVSMQFDNYPKYGTIVSPDGTSLRITIGTDETTTLSILLYHNDETSTANVDQQYDDTNNDKQFQLILTNVQLDCRDHSKKFYKIITNTNEFENVAIGPSCADDNGTPVPSLMLQVQIESPPMIGSYSASLIFDFEYRDNIDIENTSYFHRIRYITLNRTYNTQLSEVLKPTESYQARTISNRHGQDEQEPAPKLSKKQMFELSAPPLQDTAIGDNPFINLPFYDVDTDLVNMALNGEDETMIDRSFLDDHDDKDEGSYYDHDADNYDDYDEYGGEQTTDDVNTDEYKDDTNDNNIDHANNYNINDDNNYNNNDDNNYNINDDEQDDDCLDENDDGNNNVTGLTLDGKYNTFWRNMTWLFEHQVSKDIELFDLDNVKLLQERGKNRNMYSITVPGLAESRPSVLRGDVIELHFANRIYKGRVHEIRLLDVVFETKVAFSKKFNVQYDHVEILRFTVSRMAFRVIHNALSAQNNNNVEAVMKDVMLVPKKVHVDHIIKEGVIRWRPPAFLWANSQLNLEQRQAIERIIHGKMRPLPYILYGPPGTGKTTTVVETAFQLTKINNMKVLLCAPSNDAADVLVERLATFFSPSDLCRCIAYSRSIETVAPSIRKYIVGDQSSNNSTKLERIMKAKIVVSTLSLAARFTFWEIPRGHFSVLCVDEAAQAIEPEVVAVASSILDFDVVDPGQLILAGDPQQLGPIVTSKFCKKFGFDVSYMERLMKRNVYGREAPEFTTYPPDLITKLLRNYRSHKELIRLPNRLFYENELICAADAFVANTLATWEYLPQKKFPLIFHAVNGENQREGRSPSWFNEQEAEQVIEYCRLLLKETRPPIKADEIGVITPYAQQAVKIRKGLEVMKIKDVKVGSIETFQGQERRCIIISTVRSDSGFLSYDTKHSLGFVANSKRFNVAMTRAKALLIVVGCPQVLATDRKNWLPLLQFCHRNKSWLGEKWDPNFDNDEACTTENQEEYHDEEVDDGNENGFASTLMAEHEAIPIVALEE